MAPASLFFDATPIQISKGTRYVEEAQRGGGRRPKDKDLWAHINQDDEEMLAAIAAMLEP